MENMELEYKEKVLEAFKEAFGEEGARVYFAPGRVNLIGEHTDYNGGHVFPCALSIGTFAAAKKRDDRVLRFFSVNFPDSGIVETSIDDLHPKGKDGWEAYPKGVIWAFKERGMELESGFDMAVYGNIPNGSGLSSSASLEVLTGYIIRDLFGFDKVTNVDLALIGQQGENQYNGMNCGIMDQFASSMGKLDNAIFLDTATLKYEYAPLGLKDIDIIVTNTNKKHELVGSAYNDRRRESEAALKAIQSRMNIKALGELSAEEFESVKGAITDPVCLKRAKHAVYENLRTIEAVNVLKSGNLVRFGELMNESHKSLQYDYEVSCRELDILAEEAWKIDGVLGSRMTGGGFGGCTVSLVKSDSRARFEEEVGRAYHEATGMDCTFYIVSAGDGPRAI